MKVLRRAGAKLAGGILAVGIVFTLLIWSGTLSKNDAIHVANNGGNAFGYGTGVTVVGLGAAVRGLGDAVKVGQADHNGKDKVPAKP